MTDGGFAGDESISPIPIQDASIVMSAPAVSGIEAVAMSPRRTESEDDDALDFIVHKRLHEQIARDHNPTDDTWRISREPRRPRTQEDESSQDANLTYNSSALQRDLSALIDADDLPHDQVEQGQAHNPPTESGSTPVTSGTNNTSGSSPAPLASLAACGTTPAPVANVPADALSPMAIRSSPNCGTTSAPLGERFQLPIQIGSEMNQMLNDRNCAQQELRVAHDQMNTMYTQSHQTREQYRHQHAEIVTTLREEMRNELATYTHSLHEEQSSQMAALQAQHTIQFSELSAEHFNGMAEAGKTNKEEQQLRNQLAESSAVTTAMTAAHNLHIEEIQAERSAR